MAYHPLVQGICDDLDRTLGAVQLPDAEAQVLIDKLLASWAGVIEAAAQARWHMAEQASHRSFVPRSVANFIHGVGRQYYAVANQTRVLYRQWRKFNAHHLERVENPRPDEAALNVR
ncbi:MAG: hypothetical protein EPO06_11800 [Burkholderiaceae bacterium]|nr:MAG: hypothetical protein EPO06_11800 [Burkholderiaceae bacterium]